MTNGERNDQIVTTTNAHTASRAETPKEVEPTVRVLIVADPSPRREELIQALEGNPELDLIGTVITPAQALTAVRDTRPDVVLVDEEVGGVNTLPLIKDLVMQFPELIVVAIAEEGRMDHIRAAMLAGARGFVTTPLRNRELSEVLLQLYQLELARRARIAPPPSLPPSSEGTLRGKIVAVYSPKGGVGKTMLAINLAVALRQKTGGRVNVLDTHPQFGHVGLAMNIYGNYSIVDLVAHSDGLERELVDEMMPTHVSGVQVLLAPSEIERVDAISPRAFARVLRQLRDMFHWILVDTWSVLTDMTLNVLDEADRILLVATPELSTLRDVRRFLNLAQSLELPEERFSIVLNRADSGQLNRNTIEETLKLKIYATIPDDEALVTHSLNRGIPLVMSKKRSRVSRAIFRLADQLVAEMTEGAPVSSVNPLRRLLQWRGG